MTPLNPNDAFQLGRIITPEWPDLPTNIRALSTTRCDGVSLSPYDDGSGAHGFNLGSHVGDEMQAVLKNRALLHDFLPQKKLNYLTQVHGIDVVNADAVSDGHEADGCFTNQENMPCAVLTADCLPVLMCDMQGQVVVALHAGWRGLAAGILQEGVAHCRRLGGNELTAWMGPAIGPNQFEVGQDVVDAFVNRYADASHFFTPQINISNADNAANAAQLHQPKFLADIYGLARMILNADGVHRVHGGQYCTVTQTNLFYSYRRDGITGRMASVIWKTSQS